MESTLRRSQETFQSLVEKTDFGLAILQDDQVREVNPKLRQLLLLHPDDAWTDIPVQDLFPASEAERFVSWYTDHLTGREHTNKLVCSLKDRNGARIPAELFLAHSSLNRQPADLLLLHPLDRESVSDLFRYKTDWLNRVFDPFEDVLYAMTPDGVLVYVSRKIADWFKTPEELIGRNFLEFVHAQDLEPILADLQQAAMQGKAFLSVFRLEDAEGNVRLVEDQGVPIRENGETVLLCGFLRDITMRERASLQWEIQNQRLKLALIGTELGFWDWDLPTDRLQFDPTWLRRLGYEPDEVPATMLGWTGLVHEEEINALGQVLIDHCEGRTETYESELRLRRKDGSWLWVRDRGKITEWDEQGRPTRMIGLYWNIDERKKTEEALRFREEQYRLLFDNIQDGVFMIRDEHLVLGNEAFTKTLGYTLEEATGKHIQDFIAGEQVEYVLANHRRRLAGEDIPTEYETVLRKKDGTSLPVNLSIGRLVRKDDTFIIGTLKDISDRVTAERETKRLQEELLQSQKMEAIGRLAGGVAHDFNNLLTGISGHASLCLMDVSANDPHYQSLKEIEKAAERGTRLNRQLLTFTKKKLVNPQLMDLNDLVRDMDRMVSRLIPEDIQRSFQLQDDLWPILADRSQMEQVILNLVINARDAMPNGGRLVVRTRNLPNGYREDLFTRQSEPSVLLTIQDNGCGIEKEILPHIFEPFFTTKSQTHGTGLGLSTVYGVVQQHKGHIEVESQVGDGTWIHIYLPRAEGSIPPTKQSTFFNSAAFTPTEDITILVVEDDEAVRQVVTQMLKRMSFNVLAAEDGEQALALSKGHAGKIDLLLTDVVMSGMNGRELAKQIVWQRPKIKVLFTSGYSENVIAHKGVLDDGLNFLPKPYSTKSLLMKIREVLAQV